MAWAPFRGLFNAGITVSAGFAVLMLFASSLSAATLTLLESGGKSEVGYTADNVNLAKKSLGSTPFAQDVLIWNPMRNDGRHTDARGGRIVVCNLGSRLSPFRFEKEATDLVELAAQRVNADRGGNRQACVEPEDRSAAHGGGSVRRRARGHRGSTRTARRRPSRRTRERRRARASGARRDRDQASQARERAAGRTRRDVHGHEAVGRAALLAELLSRRADRPAREAGAEWTGRAASASRARPGRPRPAHARTAPRPAAALPHRCPQ